MTLITFTMSHLKESHYSMSWIMNGIHSGVPKQTFDMWRVAEITFLWILNFQVVYFVNSTYVYLQTYKACIPQGVGVNAHPAKCRLFQLC